MTESKRYTQLQMIFFFFFFFFFFIMSFGILLILHEGIFYGYSLELPRWSLSNEYPKHIFLWGNQENVYLDISIIFSYAEWLFKLDKA